MSVRNQTITKNYAIYNADCIEVMKEMPDQSIDFSVYSPPFAGLYQYSSNERDLSNARTYGEFVEHYQFVIDDIARLTKPGRLSAVHCMDVSLSNTGRGDARQDFPGDIIEMHVGCKDQSCTADRWSRKHGFCGHSDWEYSHRYDIWKEPLAVRNRTMMKALAHQTIVNDSTKSTNAAMDNVLVFRRKGENKVPVTHAEGLTNYAGARDIPPELDQYINWKGKQIENRRSHWIWRQYASSIWDDIRLDNVLQYKQSRTEEDEKHVHPLQLDVIERLVVLFTNPGEKVWTPFMGVGSEVYGAVQNERIGIGVELKPSYYNQAVKNLEDLDIPQYTPVSLFSS